jgi:hypothetical protein
MKDYVIAFIVALVASCIWSDLNPPSDTTAVQSNADTQQEQSTKQL